MMNTLTYNITQAKSKISFTIRIIPHRTVPLIQHGLWERFQREVVERLKGRSLCFWIVTTLILTRRSRRTRRIIRCGNTSTPGPEAISGVRTTTRTLHFSKMLRRIWKRRKHTEDFHWQMRGVHTMYHCTPRIDQISSLLHTNLETRVAFMNRTLSMFGDVLCSRHLPNHHQMICHQLSFGRFKHHVWDRRNC